MSKNYKMEKILLAGFMLSGIYYLMDFISKVIAIEEIDMENSYISKSFVDIEGKKEPNYKILKEPSLLKKTIYVTKVKPVLDKSLAFLGLIIFSPLYALIALAVYVDDPGTIFFTQKRIGKDKHFFNLHKFRSMRMSTPHDIPTHQLKNPEQYITRVGRFLRKTSLDELPQIWDIFLGNMSIVGPRPALWNQDDLVRERDAYGVNDILPGLTGYAQIHGRDELEIPDKARLDGIYVQSLSKGNISGFMMDLRCILKTVVSVVKQDGVVEGGTGSIKK